MDTASSKGIIGLSVWKKAESVLKILITGSILGQTGDSMKREDVAKYHEAIGVTNLFSKGARLQNTCQQLIRILLAATGQKFNIDDVRNYQINELGRSDKNTCLLELLPLPSPSSQDWIIIKLVITIKLYLPLLNIQLAEVLPMNILIGLAK